jgi:hypothetical protein
LAGCSDLQYKRDAGLDAANPDRDAAAAEARDGSAARFDASDGSRDAMVAVDGSPAVSGDAAEPASRADAAADGGASSDAEVTLPSWAAELPGQYAVQAYSFTDDGTIVASYLQRWLAVFEEVSGGYELRTQHCEVLSTNVFGNIRVLAPEKMATRRHRVLFDGESFSTEPIDVAQGYEATPPPECVGKAGELVPKRTFQTWLVGPSCRCPGPSIPMRDDCRVLDPEPDGLPGYLLQVRTFNRLGDTDLYGVSADYSKFVKGERRASGSLFARLEMQITSQQYGCRPSGCTDLSGTQPTCSTEFSSAEFVPLEKRELPAGGWSCQTMLARTGELFVSVAPVPPSRCTR